MPNEQLQALLETLPVPSTRRHALGVTPPAERSIRDGHPWVYGTSIQRGADLGKPGDLGVVFDRKDRFLAIGLIDPHSPIRLRVLHQGSSAKIDDDWFLGKVRGAWELRAPLRDPSRALTDGYRVVNGESDGLPGLVADLYADTLVLKLYSAAWIPHLRPVVAALAASVPFGRLVLRINRSMRKEPDALLGLDDGRILFGSPLEGPVVFHENGLRFEAEPVEGQKTGFFLDQRDNRARVEALSDGLDVLNVFSYTGGFSVYAARGGARSVVSVDLSRKAIDAASRNLSLNRTHPAVAACRHEGVADDAFAVLESFARQGRRFGLVILDPPMFAQSVAQVEPALRSYARLTQLGLSVLERGGILVQASCSNRVPADSFFRAIEDAAQERGRPLREVSFTGHALDHPVAFSEGAYLKCLFAKA